MNITFNINGLGQRIDLPVGTHTIDVWGADGGAVSTVRWAAGIGGYTRFVVSVTSPIVLFAYIGQAGMLSQDYPARLAGTGLQPGRRYSTTDVAGWTTIGGGAPGWPVNNASYYCGGGATYLSTVNGAWNAQNVINNIVAISGGGGSGRSGAGTARGQWIGGHAGGWGMMRSRFSNDLPPQGQESNFPFGWERPTAGSLTQQGLAGFDYEESATNNPGGQRIIMTATQLFSNRFRQNNVNPNPNFLAGGGGGWFGGGSGRVSGSGGSNFIRGNMLPAGAVMSQQTSMTVRSWTVRPGTNRANWSPLFAEEIPTPNFVANPSSIIDRSAAHGMVRIRFNTSIPGGGLDYQNELPSGLRNLFINGTQAQSVFVNGVQYQSLAIDGVEKFNN